VLLVISYSRQERGQGGSAAGASSVEASQIIKYDRQSHIPGAQKKRKKKTIVILESLLMKYFL
jgi:hypothetical protein